MKTANFPGRVFARRRGALERLSKTKEPDPIVVSVLTERTSGDARFYETTRTKKDRSSNARIR